MTADNVTEFDSTVTWPFEWWDMAMQTQRLSWNFVSHRLNHASVDDYDPFNLLPPYLNWLKYHSTEPLPMILAVGEYWKKNTRLLSNAWLGLYGIELEPVIEPRENDNRFRDGAWTDFAWFDFVKQSYLLYAEFVNACFDIETDQLSEREAEKLKFFVQQSLDAFAPTNFALTNPVAIQEAVRTNGRSLIEGYKNFLRDWERSGEQFKVSLSDPDAFELGVNIATTPGKVIFQNEFIQLIQYVPTTEKVLKQPLLVIPPWINKYYVLDLRPENSFLKWWVDQGHTVFVISWVNPDETYADAKFDDYMVNGVYAALEAIEQSTGEHRINAVGYCIGGTLLATVLAHMAARGDERIQSATFLTTMIDFSEPGEIRPFIDEEQVRKLEQRMAQHGYLEGSAMASAFSMLRANDLIWSAVINNYLLGRQIAAFDLLHWNADSTRMPASMHSFYLRNMYLDNLLCQPGGLELAGEPMDMTCVDIPVYFLSALEDHIAPWQSTYLGARLFSGPVRFVLGGSGHIAGVINPPRKNKYHYRISPAGMHDTPEQWLDEAVQHLGSWWPDWQRWVLGTSDGIVDARQPGTTDFPVIEDAPGSHARQRID